MEFKRLTHWKTPGLSPGTLIHVGEKKLDKSRVRIIDYNETDINETELDNFDDLVKFKENKYSTWINIDGVHDASLIQKIGEIFNLHPLILEDILNTTQRPKLEEYEDYYFIVLKMLTYDETKHSANVEQISFILGKNFIITFQENVGDAFDTIKERLRQNKGRIRKMGTDYLVYALIDSIIDNYFNVLEHIGDNIDKLEVEVIKSPNNNTVNKLHKMKRQVISIRRSVWPLREVINSLQREDSALITKPTRVFLRDVYDHTIQVIDTIETYRDMISGLLDLYLSTISNKMNEIMKVLTLISTVFIPLTFITGLYGMNFKFMPELDIWWAYPIIWGIMILISIVMLAFFRRKKWL